MTNCACMCLFFPQSLSKIFISFPKDSKKNPKRNTVNKGLTARELSSICNWQWETGGQGGNSEGFPARATLPPTRFLTWSKFLKNILSLHFLIWKMRILELNGHLASRPLKISGSGGTAARNTGKDVKKAYTESGLFPEQLLKIFTAAFLGGSKTEVTSHSLLFLPFQKAECEVSQ